MAPPRGIVRLTDGQLRNRRAKLTDHLDSFGDVRVEDAGAGGARRRIEFALAAPGYPCVMEVAALYREYYRRDRTGTWALAKYTYEYRDHIRDARLAYHLHELDGARAIPHAHCEHRAEPDDEETGHLRATEFDLAEANMQFMRLYATDSAPDCGAFLPLEVRRF